MTSELIPLLAATFVTLLLWPPSLWLARRIKVPPFSNPLVLASIFLCLGLWLGGIAPRDYLAAATPVTCFVPIATVALAMPLHRHASLIRTHARAMLLAAIGATLAGVGLALGLGWLLGLKASLIASIAPKSGTLAVALPLSRLTDGIDALAMAAVTFNGVGGVLIADQVWRVFARRTEMEDRAFALGISSHAMGIARMTTQSPRALSLASCGMLLSALVITALYGVALLLTGF